MIRKATIDDLDQLTILFDKYLIFYKKHTNISEQKSFLKERIENNEAIIYIAFDDEIKNKAIGFTLIYPTFSSLLLSKILILNDLYVDQNTRKSGIGEELIHQTIALAKEFGAPLIRLRTANNNMIAQSLYLKTGFTRNTFSCSFDLVIK
jgi:ribosomal protein S18 acetylase RimI-like enzyme